MVEEELDCIHVLLSNARQSEGGTLTVFMCYRIHNDAV